MTWQGKWKPEPGEIEAIQAVAARYAADPHVTQEQFNALVYRGVITTQVEAEMRRSRS